MRASTVFCAIGVAFVLAIAGLHGSGFAYFVSRMNESNAPESLKTIFPVLFLMPSLYFVVLGVFGLAAIAAPTSRRVICLVLAPAVLAAGALALLLGEGIPLLVMSAGGLAFAVAAATHTAGAAALPGRTRG